MFLEYVFFFKYILFCFGLSFLLFFISFIFVYQKPEIEKSSAYECGFNPFGDARNKFEVKFYLVGILFIIFDLEVAFLFPWVIIFIDLTFSSFIVMFIFIIILTLGSFMNELMEL